jgi:hypothetical protein
MVGVVVVDSGLNSVGAGVVVYVSLFSTTAI